MVSPDETLFQFLVDIVLHHRCPAKFAAPDDQRFIEHSALLQIFDQSGDRTIDLLTLDRQRFIDRFTR